MCCMKCVLFMWRWLLCSHVCGTSCANLAPGNATLVQRRQAWEDRLGDATQQPRRHKIFDGTSCRNSPERTPCTLGRNRGETSVKSVLSISSSNLQGNGHKKSLTHTHISSTLSARREIIKMFFCCDALGVGGTANTTCHGGPPWSVQLTCVCVCAR